MHQKYSSQADYIAKLDAILQEAINAGVPAVSAAIHSSQGVLWESSNGLADIQAQRPIGNGDLFGIGSITKLFVTVVVLQLVDEKRLRLSDTVGKLLDSQLYSGIENAADATVARLLRHEAGIDSWEDEPSWIVEGRGKAIDPARIWKKNEPLDHIRRPKAKAPDPGQWYYSNTNYTFLGFIIEKITQQSAEVEIRRRIIEPLGLGHTYLEGFEPSTPAIPPRRYHWATGPFVDDAGISPSFFQIRNDLIDVTGSNLSTEWTAGGIVSSAPDLLRLAIALRDGKLLSAESLLVMKEWRSVSRPGFEMGHGIFRLKAPHDDNTWLGHFGSVLGFTGALWWQEEGDCAVCVLANVGTVHSGNVPSSAADIIRKSQFLRVASRLSACSSSSNTS
ncbi:putative D-Ala-D-Ala carboxypeptidase [Seiridium unicorne]|uniref:D-Ala-D-Ala carboxypeptidase n=1 Tax=Seiridium unicorne TaxID=138068 RepID=A0ABR2V8J0_9PEZI